LLRFKVVWGRTELIKAFRTGEIEPYPWQTGAEAAAIREQAVLKVSGQRLARPWTTSKQGVNYVELGSVGVKAARELKILPRIKLSKVPDFTRLPRARLVHIGEGGALRLQLRRVVPGNRAYLPRRLYDEARYWAGTEGSGQPSFTGIKGLRAKVVPRVVQKITTPAPTFQSTQRTVAEISTDIETAFAEAQAREAAFFQQRFNAYQADRAYRTLWRGQAVGIGVQTGVSTPLTIQQPAISPVQQPIKQPTLTNQPLKQPIKIPTQVQVRVPVQTPINQPVRVPTGIPVNVPVNVPISVPITIPTVVTVPETIIIPPGGDKPPIILPDIPVGWGGGGGGAEGGSGYPTYTPVGMWEIRGMDIYAPSPFLRGPKKIGGRFGRRRLRYGAVQPKSEIERLTEKVKVRAYKQLRAEEIVGVQSHHRGYPRGREGSLLKKNWQQVALS